MYVGVLAHVSPLAARLPRGRTTTQVLPVLCREHHLIGALAALLRTHAAHAEVLDLVLLIIGNVAAGADAETLFALVYAGAGLAALNSSWSACAVK